MAINTTDPIISDNTDVEKTADIALLRLLQLSSVSLPVGGYAFSQGLEFAVEEGWLQNSADVSQWLSQQLMASMVCVDLPILQRQMQAAISRDISAFGYWNATILACRETAELRLTDTAMGQALRKLLGDIDVPLLPLEQDEISFVSVFALAAAHWHIDTRTACHGYLWSWLENQIAAATKLVPLGQTAAQQLLGCLLQQIPEVVDRSLAIDDHSIGTSLPALAMASAWHESQYSRLFRS